MASGEGTAVIGSSVRLRGELSGTEDIEFHGEVDGSITLLGAKLTIGPKAKVRGNISATEVVVQGHVDGNVHAKARLIVTSSAVVEGEISAPRMAVEPGAELHAIVDLTKPEEPKAPAPPPPPAPAPAPVAEARPQTELFNGDKGDKAATDSAASPEAVKAAPAAAPAKQP
ncbi:MAG TPA: polymer-forming cytoskeletal protein [Acidobacteriaceae bacterium]|jgi:cytoskeletal protein CcmA (bactofilin family)